MRKFTMAFTGLALCAALSACGGGDETAAGPVLPEPLTDAEKTALVASLPSPYHEADLAKGAEKFAMCKSCHTIAKGAANMTGPNLFGVFGRPAGSVPEFAYSDAVKESGIVWDAAQLDGWLSGPRTFLKGNKMSFAGLKDPNDRRDLIVYLMTETGYRTPSMQTAQ